MDEQQEKRDGGMQPPPSDGVGLTETPAEPKAESDAGLVFRGSSGRNDGTAEISVSEDGMTALATLIPPSGEGLPLSLDLVRDLVDSLGIKFGLDWDGIAEAVMQCNLDRHVMRDVVIARGLAPAPETPEHSTLEQKFTKPPSPEVDDPQRVDFRRQSSIMVAAKGEIVARKVPKREGVEGSDVRGKAIPRPRLGVESFVAGKNVEAGPEGLVSLIDGQLSVNGNRLDVSDVLLIKGAVDFHTGHIVFPGDVIIEGAVRDGFKVYSGGSIICKDTIDAFDISAKKDLSCTQGIIGRKHAQLRVGGELRAKFIQNCHVAVRGDIHIASAIVNSRVFSLGMLDLGDKGVVMGGEAFAVHGMRCGRLGNQAFQRTLVHIGTDFTVQQRLDRANEQLRLMTVRLRQIDEAAAAHPGPAATTRKAEVVKAVNAARGLISNLMAGLHVDEAAVLEIKGEIFPGVVIEICHVSITVEEHLRASRFRLDKTAGRIVVDH